MPRMKEIGKVDWGHTSTLGVVLALMGIAGTVWAAIKERDVATVVAGASALLAGVTTLAGRYAQAREQIKVTAYTQWPEPPEEIVVTHG